MPEGTRFAAERAIHNVLYGFVPPAVTVLTAQGSPPRPESDFESARLYVFLMPGWDELAPCTSDRLFFSQPGHRPGRSAGWNAESCRRPEAALHAVHGRSGGTTGRSPRPKIRAG
ncbi:hypothetical protein GCM10010430_46700 [Kitasatospora cystarginea]|uniref:Uncharacterized protein n=1 Tax=Kitasatospora cystarginea TaxID=58350 RepID=A0ABN3EFN9_9ACTN